MRAKEFIIEAIPLDQLRSVGGAQSQADRDLVDKLKKSMPSKPRNFVSKNAKMGGAGQHKDKKKAEKQGDFKHKQKTVPMENNLSELSTEKLAQYKKAAYADAKKADADGDYARGDKRFKGINRATNKQFDNDLKKHGQQSVAEGTGNDFRVGQQVIYTTGRGEKFPSIVTAVDFDEDAVKIKSANNKPFPNNGGDIEIVVDPGWKFLTAEPRVDPNSIIAVSPSMRKTTERIRDPEDWDEGNTEPPNNFAVYINGKKWKVFKGRGQYADDAREQAHHEQLKGWAAKKSAATGKQWSVSITGEPATE